MADRAKFWDRTAPGYAKGSIRNEEAYRRKLEITQGYFKPEMEVMEFACGTGTTAIAHAPHVKHILAIDISAKMLEIAAGKADAQSITNITFQQSTIEEFEADDRSFDVVMAHSILHLLEEPEQAMMKVHKLLKPDGVFVTSTVCLQDMISIWRIAIPIARLFRAIPYVKILSRRELDCYFANTGFDIDYQWEQKNKEAAFIIARKSVA